MGGSLSRLLTTIRTPRDHPMHFAGRPRVSFGGHPIETTHQRGRPMWQTTSDPALAHGRSHLLGCMRMGEVPDRAAATEVIRIRMGPHLWQLAANAAEEGQGGAGMGVGPGACTDLPK